MAATTAAAPRTSSRNIFAFPGYTSGGRSRRPPRLSVHAERWRRLHSGRARRPRCERTGGRIGRRAARRAVVAGQAAVGVEPTRAPPTCNRRSRCRPCRSPARAAARNRRCRPMADRGGRERIGRPCRRGLRDRHAGEHSLQHHEPTPRSARSRGRQQGARQIRSHANLSHGTLAHLISWNYPYCGTPNDQMASGDNAFIEITPKVLLKAYACGSLPMADSGGRPGAVLDRAGDARHHSVDRFHCVAARPHGALDRFTYNQPRLRRRARRLRRAAARPPAHLDQCAHPRPLSQALRSPPLPQPEVYDGHPRRWPLRRDAAACSSARACSIAPATGSEGRARASHGPAQGREFQAADTQFVTDHRGPSAQSRRRRGYYKPPRRRSPAKGPIRGARRGSRSPEPRRSPALVKPPPGVTLHGAAVIAGWMRAVKSPQSG